MKRALVWLLCCAAGQALLAESASASGLDSLLFSPRSGGAANAVTARVDDYSALYFNPAGLVIHPGAKFSAGMAMFLSDYEYSEPKVVGGKYTPLNVAAQGTATFSFLGGYTDNFGLDKWGFGFGVYAPYRQGVRWGDDFLVTGEEKDFRYQVTEMSYETYFISVGAAYRPNNNLAFGASLSWAPTRYSFKSLVDMSAYLQEYPDGSPDTAIRDEVDVARFSRLKYDYKGNSTVTGTIGMWWRPVKGFHMGLSYQPQVALKLSGTTEIRKQFNADIPSFQFLDPVTGVPDAELQDYYFFSNSDSELNLILPQKIRIGFLVGMGKRTYLSLDAVHTGWSGLSDATYNDEDLAKNLINHRGPAFAGWEDALTVSLGVNWVSARGFEFRGGYCYDQSAIPNEYLEGSLIDNSKHILSIGAGLPIKNTLRLDFSFAHFWVAERHVAHTQFRDRGDTPNTNESANGTYGNSEDTVTVGLTYFFGGRKKTIFEAEEYAEDPTLFDAPAEGSGGGTTPPADDDGGSDDEDGGADSTGADQ